MSEKPKATFGDLVENGWASEENPTRTGYFVREFRRPHGRMNAGLTWEITNGKGKFWELSPVGEHKITVTPRILAPAVPVVGDEHGAMDRLKAGLEARNIDLTGTRDPVVAALVAISHYQGEREGNPLANVESVLAAPPPVGAVTVSAGIERYQLGLLLMAAFSAGATAVHENYEPDPNPDFSEAASDYAVSALAALLSGSTPKPAGVEITEEMVERAAQAIVDVRWNGSQPGFDRKPPGWKTAHVEEARAALTAALTPSDGAAS